MGESSQARWSAPPQWPVNQNAWDYVWDSGNSVKLFHWAEMGPASWEHLRGRCTHLLRTALVSSMFCGNQTLLNGFSPPFSHVDCFLLKNVMFPCVNVWTYMNPHEGHRKSRIHGWMRMILLWQRRLQNKRTLNFNNSCVCTGSTIHFWHMSFFAKEFNQKNANLCESQSCFSCICLLCSNFMEDQSESKPQRW